MNDSPKILFQKNPKFERRQTHQRMQAACRKHNDRHPWPAQCIYGPGVKMGLGDEGLEA